MTQVILSAEDLAAPLHLPLPPGATLLVGREPDAQRLPQALPEGTVLRCCTIASQRISANHLLIASRADGVFVQDLASRNGSWLRLPPGQWIPVAGPAPLRLVLARADLDAPAAPPPIPDAQWHSAAEFATSVAAQVRAHLTGLGVIDELEVLRPASDSDPSAGSQDNPDVWPLANGARLALRGDPDKTLDVVRRAVLERARCYVNQQNLRFEKELGLEEDFVLASPRLREVHGEVVDAAVYGRRLMILGPTGAGKDRLARRYHQRSPLHGGPFVAVNCALLRADLLYAQLFGAKKGSFTGCQDDIIGFVEQANHGTLFLDEAGELELAVQKSLLRFLDTGGEHTRLGDPRKRHAAVQLVCATNVALDDPGVRHGKFREDLWYRLAVQVVRVPPLRERPEDIIAYLQRRRLRGAGRSVYEALSREALQAVLAEPWPGNFRDLDNFVERLPAGAALDQATCLRAIKQGRNPGALQAPSGAAVDRAAPQAPHSLDLVLTQARAAFNEDHGGAPSDWGQLQLFTEKYLKPVFVANALGLLGLETLSRELNFSELARRMHIADGSTVKMQLKRYVKRFRSAVPGSAAQGGREPG